MCYTASVCVRGDAAWVCATRRDLCPGVHRKSLLRRQNLRCPLHPLRVLGALQERTGPVSRANVRNLSGVLHPIYAFPYHAAGPKHPQGPGPILPASRPAPCRIHPSPPSLSPGAAASALSPALRKATPHRGRAVFIRNKTQRAGLLWQVCSKYWLEHGGRLVSGDYTLLPRETLPRLVQAQQKVSVNEGRVDAAPSQSGTAGHKCNETGPLGSESIYSDYINCYRERGGHYSSSLPFTLAEPFLQLTVEFHGTPGPKTLQNNLSRPKKARQGSRNSKQERKHTSLSEEAGPHRVPPQPKGLFPSLPTEVEGGSRGGQVPFPAQPSSGLCKGWGEPGDSVTHALLEHRGKKNREKQQLERFLTLQPLLGCVPLGKAAHSPGTAHPSPVGAAWH